MKIFKSYGKIESVRFRNIVSCSELICNEWKSKQFGFEISKVPEDISKPKKYAYIT